MKSGDVLRIDLSVSVQFLIPITVRVIRLLDWPTYDGWAWIDVYQLDSRGEAVTRRSLFIRPNFVEYVPRPPARPTGTAKRKPAVGGRGRHPRPHQA